MVATIARLAMAAVRALIANSPLAPLAWTAPDLLRALAGRLGRAGPTPAAK